MSTYKSRNARRTDRSAAGAVLAVLLVFATCAIGAGFLMGVLLV